MGNSYVKILLAKEFLTNVKFELGRSHLNIGAGRVVPNNVT